MQEAASAIPHLPSNLPLACTLLPSLHKLHCISEEERGGAYPNITLSIWLCHPTDRMSTAELQAASGGGGKCSCTDISSTPDLILTHLWYASATISCQNILQHVTGDNLSWIGWNIAGSRVKVRREEEEWDCKQVSPGCNCAFVHFVCYKLMIFHNFHLANQTM